MRCKGLLKLIVELNKEGDLFGWHIPFINLRINVFVKHWIRTQRGRVMESPQWLLSIEVTQSDFFHENCGPDMGPTGDNRVLQ